MGFRIVQKFNNNILDIGVVLANGNSTQIARIIFPDDKQVNDNLEAANAICVILKKRIRKSV